MAGKDPVLKWIEIDDFTPGIIQNLNLAGGLGASNELPAPGKVPGQAQQAQGCIALPNGGLAPLPGIAPTMPWGAATPVAPQHVPVVGAGAENLICGLFLNGPLYYYGGITPFPQTVGDELIIGQSERTAAGNQQLWIDSLQAGPAGVAVNNIVNKGPFVSRLPLATMTGGTTRAATDPATVGEACWALAYWITAGAAGVGPSGYWAVILYPDPTNPGAGAFVPHVLINGTGGPGEVFCHQNRIVYLQTSPTQWTSAFVLMGGNEEFLYTDPPNGVALLNDVEVFVQEDPSGYGAWGSQSASELFLVKNRLGGVVISGDLNVPTVTPLPGVMPTYGLMSRASSTPVGFVYASNNRGLWVWNGGSGSFKLSNQLEDDFFVNPNLPTIQAGPTVDIQRWGDWIVVTNDWLYDTNTNSWWMLPQGAQGTGHQWYQASSDGMTLYAAPAVPSATVGLECYSRAAPANDFTWKSFPIRPPTDSKDKGFIVRRVVIRAQGSGTVGVVLTGRQGSSSAGASSPGPTLTFETAHDPTQPSMQVVEMGLSAQDITVLIESEGETATTPAPIVYSIAIGYEEAPGCVSAT
jgi:hypothetical protein